MVSLPTSSRTSKLTSRSTTGPPALANKTIHRRDLWRTHVPSFGCIRKESRAAFSRILTNSKVRSIGSPGGSHSCFPSAPLRPPAYTHPAVASHHVRLRSDSSRRVMFAGVGPPLGAHESSNLGLWSWQHCQHARHAHGGLIQHAPRAGIVDVELMPSPASRSSPCGSGGQTVFSTPRAWFSATAAAQRKHRHVGTIRR